MAGFLVEVRLGSLDGIVSAATWATGVSRCSEKAGLTELSDNELMSLVVAGDQAALAILMRRHARAVLAVGRRVLHDQGAAEELVQDVFLLIYRRRQLFNSQRGSFRGWLIQIAYHEAYRARQRVSLRHVYEDQTLETCLDVIATRASPEYHATILEREDLLRQAFKQLVRKQKETMELFFFEGYTLREISERLGESLGNVRHYYYRGLEHLKERVDSAQVNSHA